MAAPSQLLTVPEFDALYGDRKPSFEYLLGDARQKEMPTKLHSALQMILGFLLRELGLFPYSELRLAISPQIQLVPDLSAFSRPFPGQYPTQPFDVAIEIVSPSDPMQYLFRKCRLYAEWNIQHILVFDPEDRTAFEWNRETASLQNVAAIAITGRAILPVARVWSELDAYLEPSA